jgi:hypothetical protein
MFRRPGWPAYGVGQLRGGALRRGGTTVEGPPRPRLVARRLADFVIVSQEFHKNRVTSIDYCFLIRNSPYPKGETVYEKDTFVADDESVRRFHIAV